MSIIPDNDGKPRATRWVTIAWVTFTAFILLLPLVAMRFTDEVNWTTSDFVFAGAMLTGAGLTYEVLARRTANLNYRLGVAVAVVTAVLLVWTNGAVGIIGNEDNPANLMYGCVLAIGLVGAAFAGFRAAGMAWTLGAMAAAHGVICAIALAAGLGKPLEVSVITVFFATLWLVAAGLFYNASRT
jgi:hypothetical protein